MKFRNRCLDMLAYSIALCILGHVVGCSSTEPESLPTSDSPNSEAAANLSAQPDKQVSAATPETDDSSSLTVDAESFRMAAYEGNIAIVREALKSGVDINASDAQQQLTALHMAAYNGHTQVVRLLLENGAKVDPRDHEGKTPLTHACTGPFRETVELLLNSGADINAREATEGFTPLMMAAGTGQAEVVKVLLSHDADAGIRDQDDDRAIDHARNSGHVEIMNLLGS